VPQTEAGFNTEKNVEVNCNNVKALRETRIDALDALLALVGRIVAGFV